MTVRHLFVGLFFCLCGIDIATSHNMKDDGCIKIAVLILGIYIFYVCRL